MCALLVGLPNVIVLGIDDEDAAALRVHVETVFDRPVCAACGTAVRVKDRPVVELVDLPCFGRPTRLVWHKRRWCCGV
jgi:transposase